MREIIRFASGKSYLGKFQIAVSQQGVIACEFDEADLRKRFPDADLVADQDGLAYVIEQIGRRIADQTFDPQLRIDTRGVPYQLRIWWRHHQLGFPNRESKSI